MDAYQKQINYLIHAVCGAGKTEIIYEVILKAINEGKLVAFATPRKDVVLELVPRFKRDFCGFDIIALYGGSTERGKFGHLYVTTTHQLIHFSNFFDLIILDEVDAFPFYNDEMLEGFVEKAKKQGAPIIYLTATPTKKLKQMMKQKKLAYYLLPSRFHGYPIPVPEIRLVPYLHQSIERGIFPSKVSQFLEQKNALGRQVFIFVPSINLGKKVEQIMRHRHYNAEFVSSESENRNAVIQRFRRGDLQFIITTTILERGVTVSNVDVCILFASAPIFDDRAIVQIVGRAGRDQNYPNADVLLFTEDYTKAMKEAIHQIRYMNRISKTDQAKKGKNGMHCLSGTDRQ